ncbi:uncharacterized protein ASPGLDRAFT_1088877 [Aspergillus glaucus CBS 516.65]|uniref:Uncharacterized protein n=1 Tax=Aspergillus glaucus CBS 516.65 TaxID=1160497 RepID=A0A1L9V4U2_ASPGL|nr:hypothetical protein ASPGLDRAFT_1088877 [Aspergillus glaucus CBS 516.65]OJJ78954.1 hypothetical protein ASPGLDRAFT_1088877 [Aspergillus glaucus CBS 516.65]
MVAFKHSFQRFFLFSFFGVTTLPPYLRFLVSMSRGGGSPSVHSDASCYGVLVRTHRMMVWPRPAQSTLYILSYHIVRYTILVVYLVVAIIPVVISLLRYT